MKKARKRKKMSKETRVRYARGSAVLAGWKREAREPAKKRSAKPKIAGWEYTVHCETREQVERLEQYFAEMMRKHPTEIRRKGNVFTWEYYPPPGRPRA
jgi:hypothetical protein